MKLLNKKFFSGELKASKGSTLCLYPYMNMMMNADGTYKPCCKYQGNITDKGRVLNASTDSLQDAWESDSVKLLREQFTQGKKPAGCTVCWKEEDAGIRSMRYDSFHYGLKEDALDNPDHPVRLDIYPSNICNLQCRICSPRYSTKWIQEAKETMGIIEERHMNLTDENITWIRKWLPDLREIGLFGGEPLYLKECIRVMEICVETGASEHITLLINTNATIYSDKIADLLRHFKKVLLNFSIDDIGRRFEYQRKGADWEEAVENIRQYLKIGGYGHEDQIECKICCTVSALNIYYLPEFLQWVDKEFPGKKVYLNMLYGPWALSSNILPDKVKAVVADRLASIPPLNLSFDTKQTRTIDNVRDYLMTKPVIPFEDFVVEIERGDKYRKESFAEVFPEFYGIIKPYI